NGGEEKSGNCKEETALAHVTLVKFRGGAGEKQDGGEQDGVAQILRCNITGPFSLGIVSPGISIGKPRVLDETRLIKIRYKGMGIGVGIIERLFRHPGVIRFA